MCWRFSAKVADDVFDDHDRAVHQHADGDGQAAQRHQVGGHAELLHQNESDEHRQRQRQGHDQRGAQVAEEQHQQDDDQHDGFGERLGDRADGALHQAAAVVEDLGRHALRQGGCEFGEFRVHTFHYLLRVRAAQTEHQAFHRFAFPVHGHHAIARQAADADLGDVADADRVVARVGDHDVFHVVQCLDAAFGAYQQRFVAVTQASCAIVAVVGLQRLLQLQHGESACSKCGVIGDHFEAARQAAQRIDIGYAG